MRQTLAEDLLLLAYHDEKGTIIPPARTDILPFAYVAGLVMDLSLLGKIALKDDLLEVSDPSTTRDPLLDGVLKTFSESKDQASMEDWISRLFKASSDLEDQLLDRLVSKGILERKEKKILWVFSNTHYPSKEPSSEQALREQVRRVLVEDKPPDDRIRILISLIYTTGLLSEVSPADQEEKIARDRAKSLSDGLAHMDAISKAVAAANTALGRVVAGVQGRAILDKPLPGYE